MVFLILFLIFVVTTGLLLVVLVGVLKFYMGLINKNKEDRTLEYSFLNQTAEKGKIVFLGDSLTEGFLVKEYFRNYPVINRGVGGNTTAEVLERLETTVLNIEPAKLFILIGTNDLGFNTPVNEVIENIKKMLNIIQEKSPGTQIFLISLLPVGHFRKLLPGLTGFIISKFLAGKYRNNKHLSMVNNELILIAKERKITYIDVSESLKDEHGFLKEEFTIEGLHLTTQAYQVISEKIKPYL